MKLGIIGGGAMGEAIIAALTAAGIAEAAQIAVADVAPERPRYLSERYGVRACESNAAAATGVDYLVLAVKPQDFERAAADLKGHLSADAIAVSIMAGVPIAKLEDQLDSGAVVRAIPNTPAQIGEGMTVWTATAAVGESARDGLRQIFAALGKEAFVPEERYLDMATALSGSGPAYVFLFIEALTDAGVHVGLARELASALALQTVAGAARYAAATGKHPAELRAQVSSPGGTTVEGLRALETGGLRAAVMDAVIAAFEKSKALGEGVK